jgi:parallel beta-helix repeat protein
VVGHPSFVGDGTGGNKDAIEFGWSAEDGLRIASSEYPGAVIAAQRYSVVAIDGADDVILHGLGFEDTLTPSKRAGLDFEGGANYNVNSFDWLNAAAISIDDADDIVVTENRFERVGQALNLHDASGGRILGNVISDLGRDGIVLRGDSDGTLVAGNTIEGIGRVIAGSMAVDIVSPGGVDHTTIAHNSISDSARGAISTGNEKTDGALYGLRVSGNVMENLGLQAGDAGAIHTYSRSTADTGAIIEGNVIRHVKGYILQYDNVLHDTDTDGEGTFDLGEPTSFPRSFADGVYVDVRTNDARVLDNLIDDVSNAAVHVHGGHDIQIKNNYALLDRDGGEPGND